MAESPQEQKAKLLDNFISNTTPRTLPKNFVILKKNYKAIAPQKTHSEDPYIDDVFSTRLVNMIRKAFFQRYLYETTEIKVSHLNDKALREKLWLNQKFGPSAEREFADVMEKHK